MTDCELKMTLPNGMNSSLGPQALAIIVHCRVKHTYYMTYVSIHSGVKLKGQARWHHHYFILGFHQG